MRGILRTTPPRVVDMAAWQLRKLIEAGKAQAMPTLEHETPDPVPEIAVMPEQETAVLPEPRAHPRWPERRRKKWPGR